jgi:hypothetical protein
MGRIETEVAREVKAVTRVDVMGKAVEGTITWSQAAEVLRVTPRHMLRLRWVYEQFGVPGLRDRRTGRRMPTQTGTRMPPRGRSHSHAARPRTLPRVPDPDEDAPHHPRAPPTTPLQGRFDQRHHQDEGAGPRPVHGCR